VVWYTAVVGLLAYWGYNDTGQVASLFGRSNLVSGLLFLAGIVGLVGLAFLLLGLLVATGDCDPIENDRTSLGLDIVGAFGIAIAIAAICFSVPSTG
jgi:hypothetical protein